MRPWIGGVAIVSSLFGAACSAEREPSPPPPVFITEVGPLLQQRCLRCHEGPAPKAGFRVESYLDVIRCLSSGRGATEASQGPAPILSALDSEAHRGLVSDAEKELLVAWVEAGSPAFRGTVHPPGIIDPRSDAWHGAQLRANSWRPMLDADSGEACGRCHDGSPSRPPGVTSAAPGATACTQCHAAPNGVLACGTCHGDGARASPPRDPCFFPSDADRSGAHAAHVTASASHPALACTTCHPAVGDAVRDGVHLNGAIDIAFDPDRAGPDAHYDPATGSCTVSCHSRGGARPQPAWTEVGAMACGDCHTSPPPAHFPGSCTSCHRQANSTGTALAAGTMHMNGKLDLGDGSGTCGACHGNADDPWPLAGAHASHRTPAIASPIACATCHVVPQTMLDSGHMNGTVEVVLSGRASDRHAHPAWDGRTCSEVACHGAALSNAPALTPIWTDSTGSARACGACHGIPPEGHTASRSCERSTCHGSEIERTLTSLAITPSGKALHVNGVVDATPLPQP